MTPKNFKIVNVDKSQYLNYLKKAEEFYASMIQAEKSEHWNAVGLNAVHCAISISDALLVKFSGVRSIETDHMLVVDIIKQNLRLEGIDEKLGTLRRILAKKSIVEYDNAIFTKSDAVDCIKKADRLYHWGREELVG
jgi:hypothetical protein